ncbi:MAG TPA: methionyl-tRNA formyltransferase [Candidatus Prevotella avicola]|uniref:Methionyl-tRNA formyltransferase n=1 Tax=Candidatus Prevotella avicola TaxID=2838738 RepID=A0A9D2JWC1_9BACT|nr:methionyl-tRNA formyltransferase [Candidatus Prevotella avicola]
MEKKDLRIVFMGTPEFAVGTLRALVEGGYNVVAVVTQPDKPVGRHQDTLQPSAVKTYALEHGLPVLQPVKMKDPDFVEALRQYKADLQVVVAFRMLPEIVWDMPRLGTFNVHAALLPQYRGAAPINWAIINGETETGVTTFFLDKDIDTGKIILQEKFPIPDDANVEYVYDGLMELGAKVALQTIDRILEADGQIEATPQAELLNMPEERLRLAPKIFKETCQIDFRQNAKRVYDFIRGLSPIPGAWTLMAKTSEKPLTLKIYKACKTGSPTQEEPGTLMADGKRLLVACADEWLQIDTLQLSGKKKMETRDFLNGMRDINEYQTTTHS